MKRSKVLIVFGVVVATVSCAMFLIRENDNRVKTAHVQRQTQTVYITRTGKKYHRASCGYLRQSKIPMELSDAAASYGPCSRCKPPKGR